MSCESMPSPPLTLCQCVLISLISGGTTFASLPAPWPPDPPITALAVAIIADDLVVGARGRGRVRWVGVIGWVNRAGGLRGYVNKVC